ncbi:MAG TPA: hypothetical protein VH418_16740 [Solirubrobacteraceae bacterium]|jgi:putative Mn2+ efflux pump MntP
MRKSLEIGGFIAAAVLIVFGTAAIVLGFNGRSTVQSTLKQEQIVGTPDMTPKAISAEAKQAGLKNVALPTKSVAGQAIDTGSEARTFAGYMRIHALEATGGLTYAQMPRYATADGKGTNIEAQATKSPTGQPLDNPKRAVWINETALATALNASYMADQIAIFGIVVGIALLLTGVGFAVLAAAGALRNREAPIAALGRKVPAPDTSLAAPTA